MELPKKKYRTMELDNDCFDKLGAIKQAYSQNQIFSMAFPKASYPNTNLCTLCEKKKPAINW